MKNYFKHGIITLAVAGLLTTFTSCDKDKDNNTSYSLVGEWNQTKYEVEIETEPTLNADALQTLKDNIISSQGMPIDMDGLVYTMNADKTVRIDNENWGDGFYRAGNYVYADNKLRVDIYLFGEDVAPQQYGPYALTFESNNKMYLWGDVKEYAQGQVDQIVTGAAATTVKKAVWKLPFDRKK